MWMGGCVHAGSYIWMDVCVCIGFQVLAAPCCATLDGGCRNWVVMVDFVGALVGVVEGGIRSGFGLHAGGCNYWWDVRCW